MKTTGPNSSEIATAIAERVPALHLVEVTTEVVQAEAFDDADGAEGPVLRVELVALASDLDSTGNVPLVPLHHLLSVEEDLSLELPVRLLLAFKPSTLGT